MLYDNFMRLRMRSMLKYKTASGYPCTFSNTNSQIENYRIYGNTIDGEGVGDKTANLCDVSQKIHKNGNYTFSETNQEFTSEWINASAMFLFKASVKPNTKYTVYYDIYSTQLVSSSSTNLQFAYDTVSVSAGYIKRINVSGDSLTDEKRYQSTYTFTTKDSAEELYIYINNYRQRVRGRLMVAEAESITEYEPFGYKIPIKINDTIVDTAYTQLPLNKTDTNVDYLDYKSGKVINYIDGVATTASAILPKITTVSGTNAITTGTTIEPSNITVRYGNAELEFEGYPCSFSGKVRRIRNYQIYGDSTQDGTPSPENPVEIQSVGDLVTDETSEYYGKYDVPVTVRGKNLINESAVKLSSGYWSDIDGHPIGNNSRFIRISSVKCNPNEKYTLSSNLNIYSIWFFNNDTAISKITGENMVVAVNTPENCNRLRISLCNTSGNTDTVAFKWIQLELGTTATSYEPYIAPVTTNIYLNEPLRKVGDYADYIDYKNQKVFRQIEVLDGTGTKPIDESLGTLATPIEESVYLPPLSTVINGTNIITTGTTVEPSNIKIKYKE